jgi:hypothetical protein
MVERAGQQQDAADEGRREWTLAADLAVLRTTVDRAFVTLVRLGVALAAVALGLVSSLPAGLLVWILIGATGGRSVFLFLGVTLVAVMWVVILASLLRGVEWFLSRGRIRGSAWAAALGTAVGLPAGTILRTVVFGKAPESGYPSSAYAFLYLVTLAAALAAVYLAAWIKESRPAPSGPSLS